MITISIERLAETVGFDIALSTDQAQADLLNGLACGFNRMSSIDRDIQMTSLFNLLDEDAIKFVKDLHQFTEVR